MATRTTPKRIHLQERVNELLGEYNTSDILRILTHEGTPILEITLRRIRADLGVKLRCSPEERRAQLDKIEAILINEFIIGEIEDFGRRPLRRYLHA